MIWIFGILQVIFIQIGWWVYNSYFIQPRHNHPAIFWNPLLRTLLIYGPTVGIVGLVIAAFFLTSHPWFFLGFTLILWGFGGRKKKASAPDCIIMPVLSEEGVVMEAVSTDELLKDIRAFRHDSSQKKKNGAKED
ncbi:MAG: hypothetical protein IPH06_06310 [Alphaproteobacteria bacterium]|nr:hypothetical protein [Alphaproteobacteria bacterium]QQS57631.1 MAG: hypothetical protein IPN28_02075 [Alphaproteobacteria bacterium]